MKILYFASVDFFAKPNPSFHLMTALIEDLLNEGHYVNFIGCKLRGIDKHIPDIFLKNEKFKYYLIDTPNTSKSNFLKRYFDGIIYARKAKKFLKKFYAETDVVFIQSSPTVYYNISVARSVFNDKKIIYNVQDMFPGSSIASGVMKNKFIQEYFFKKQKKAYKKSDVIVCISDDMKLKLQEQGVSSEKIETIVNWYDDKTVKYISKNNKFIEKYKLSSSKFYVQYAGTMGYVFDYNMVLKVAKLLEGEKDIEFQMIGEGSQKEIFLKEKEVRRLKNIVFYPLQPQEMVSDVYSACNVCFIPLKLGVIGNSVPSKAGLLMACHKPIITSADYDSLYNEMINKNKIGFAFGNNDENKIAAAIIYLKENPEDCRLLGENAFKYGHELYSRTSNTKKYIDLFKRLC